MNVKNLIFFSIILFNACFSGYSQKELEVLNPKSDSLGFLYYKGGEIKSNAFSQPKIIVSIHPDSLLKSFYPGAFYRYNIYETDTISVVLWYCNDAKPELIQINEFDEDSLRFIDTVLYDTRLLMCDTFTDNLHQKFAWVALNTTPAQADFLLTGRFCSGILSLALLKLNGDVWSVVNFDKAFGTYGMFCMSPTPKLVEYRKGGYGLKLINYIGGFGGPFWGSYSLLDEVEGKVQEILFLDGANFEYEDSCSWETNLVLSDTLQNDELMLVTKGNINREKFLEIEETLTSLPTELATVLKKKKNISFSIQRTYKLVNHKYELKSTQYKTL
jgi:hypothetical protein